ncbi:MAG TPA: lysylphosphatidylglycerol synthase transmembrane domain-containing protein [Gemmataceae bacterium]|nr:lysylphosphatidylglycerol synthase transmembrane domain-containing protein [Gemmataceae bacterium]
MDTGALVAKRLLVIFLKYFVGFAILGYMIWRYWESPPDKPGTGISDIKLDEIHFGPLLIAFLLCAAGNFICWVRWFVLVRAQELPFTFLNGLRLGMVGFFFNTFMPGSVGGDIIKATFIAREQSRRAFAVGSVIIDRLIGLMGLFWLSAILGWFFWWLGYFEGEQLQPLQAALFLVTGIVGGSLLFWLALKILSESTAQNWTRRLEGIPKIGPSLAELWRALLMYRRKGITVGLALLMATAGHIGFVTAYYLSSASLIADTNLIPSVFVHFLIVPLGMVGQAGIPLPGAIGAGEALFAWLYVLVGKQGVFGFRMALVYRINNWVLGFISYIVYLQVRPALKTKKENAGSAPSPLEVSLNKDVGLTSQGRTTSP